MDGLGISTQPVVAQGYFPKTDYIRGFGIAAQLKMFEGFGELKIGEEFIGFGAIIYCIDS